MAFRRTSSPLAMFLIGMVSIILYLCVVYLAPYSIWKTVEVGRSKHNTILSPPFAGKATLPLDHFNSSDLRTFQNRYWMNDTHLHRNGPVFFFDAGEAGLSDEQAAQMLSGQILFAPLELARKYHGAVIIWEHRFFGRSMPFEYNDATGIAHVGQEAYRYLKNEQALEDAVFFATHFSYAGHEHGAMSAKSVPWIWIGGSYPGIRAAMVRTSIVL
jgi:hypothetical protein